MLAIVEDDINEIKKVSIRYDDSMRTYYCFYRRMDQNLCSELILSYDLNESQWIIDPSEFKNLFEDKFNELFAEENIPFEEQLPHVIEYLDTYFMNQSQPRKTSAQQRVYSLPWFRRFRGIRRWTSHGILPETSAVLQRYSAPEESKNEEIISVKCLAESFYGNNPSQRRRDTCVSLSEPPNVSLRVQKPSKPPPISEIWLNVACQEEENFPKKISADKLKKLAEKFVTYFGGTFQCNVGHKYELESENQIWHFVVLKVEFLMHRFSGTTKAAKTKIVFLINGIPHYVRG